MALINCSECNHDVSDKAEACPKCGAPIAIAEETKAAGVQIKTIQETSKKFKIQTLMSVVMICVGSFWMMVAAMAAPSSNLVVPQFMVVIGFIWYTVNRFRIWWHHE